MTAKTDIRPLHSTVKDASSGDAGWCWYEDKWHLGQITLGDDDRLYLDLILEEKSTWFHVEDMVDLLWYPVFRPPYEGDERPSTHAVTIMDRDASCTISWSMNVHDGRRAAQRVSQYIDAMLAESNAEPVI